jgi:hypothetical protein
MSTLATTPHAEGHSAARLVLARMALCHDTTEQAELLHEAMLDLIDVSLGWNNLEPTCERLAGFAQVIAQTLAWHLQPLDLLRLPCALSLRVTAVTGEVCHGH